jgi:hypothetical protein
MKHILCTFLPAAWAMFIFWCFDADLTHQGFGLGTAVFFATVTGAMGFAFYKAWIE